MDLVQDFASSYKSHTANLTGVLERFNDKLPLMAGLKDAHAIAVEFETMRRNYHGSVFILFDIFEKAFPFLASEETWRNTFGDFRDNYIRFRYHLISTLHADALRKKLLQTERKKQLNAEIKKLDAELFLLLEDLIGYHKQQLERGSDQASQVINYATWANVTADSEYKADPQTVCRASNVVSGRWDNWMTDSWHSNLSQPVHWLMLDLLQPRAIVKFVIRHSNAPGYITMDFKIQGSHDQDKWILITSVNNNESCLTVHEVEDCVFRYIRLYITYPSPNDFQARIFEFEAWGLSFLNK